MKIFWLSGNDVRKVLKISEVIKVVASKDSKVVGMIGTGRSSEGIEKIEEACECDVLVTTTPVREPIVKIVVDD